ncbi:hypothetical protein BH09CHL1_BH09CHL1_24600 [soil metagenome]
MRNSLKWFSAIALALLLGGMVLAPVSAQDDEEFDLDQLEGIQRSVGRFYYSDFGMSEAMGTPASEDTPTPLVDGLSVAIMEFDNDDNADTSFDRLYDELLISATESNEEDVDDLGTPIAALDVSEVDVDGLGDDAKAFTVAGDDAEGAFNSYALITRDGEYLYMVIAYGSGDASEAIQQYTEDMMDRDAGDGDGTFNEDGSSTGGLWDIFPGADNALLVGLLSGGDQILFPIGTPEADS